MDTAPNSSNFFFALPPETVLYSHPCFPTFSYKCMITQFMVFSHGLKMCKNVVIYCSHFSFIIKF